MISYFFYFVQAHDTDIAELKSLMAGLLRSSQAIVDQPESEATFQRFSHVAGYSGHNQFLFVAFRNQILHI
ncbi:hypothetical protein C354_05120 [Cryptococcus neoformans MW-RSA1955]|nr:hypothetical protein C354_05120 [Cryptococcus neoformans var. grubii MW-RSA1955]